MIALEVIDQAMRSVPRAVATGSQLSNSPSCASRNPVATALGTDLLINAPGIIRLCRTAIKMFSSDQNPTVNPPELLVEGEDYYWEGEAIVFTAQYHLRRGYCCDSGCRHCPYEAEGMKEPDTFTSK
jgi:hypothetical protein